MAAPAKGKDGGKGGAGGKAKKKGRKLSALYVLGEKLQRKNKFCPKCGPGYFLGGHSNRVVCGKCHYVEFGKKV